MSSSDDRTPTFTTWESYLYPETMTDGVTGTLRNIPGYRDEDDLKQFEYDEALDREIEIGTGAVEIARTYDADHLRAIHHHLFKNVYEWAGEYRTVDMQKDATQFAAPSQIDRYLMNANKVILETDWPQVDRKGFADATAEVYANLNQAHPFREGNGRAGKLFMQHVAELSNFRIVYDPQTSNVTRELWNQQSMLSAPDYGKLDVDPTPLKPIFYSVARPAPAGPTADLAVARVARVQMGTRSLSDTPALQAGDRSPGRAASPGVPTQDIRHGRGRRR